MANVRIDDKAFGYGEVTPIERVTGAVPTIETNHAFIHEGMFWYEEEEA